MSDPQILSVNSAIPDGSHTVGPELRYLKPPVSRHHIKHSQQTHQ